MRKFVIACAVVAVALIAAGPAQAATVIDFGTGYTGPGGTITWDGQNVVGVGIPVGALTVSGAPANNGAWFTTGSFGYEITDPGGTTWDLTSAVLNFGYGLEMNYIEIVGGVSNTRLSRLALLTGTFGAAPTTQLTTNGVVAHGWGSDTKNSDLLTWVGLPTSTPFAWYGFSIAAQQALDSEGHPIAGRYVATSTDISNTAVPEPGSMLLLGTGLFGLAGAVRRRMKK